MTLVRQVPAVSVHQGAAALKELASDWRTLFAEHGGWNVFLSWQWFYQWWDCFGPDKQMQVLAIREAGRVVGIAPLMIETDGEGVPRLALIGSDRTCDYGDLLADPRFVDPLCDALVDFVDDGFDRWGSVELRNLPESSPLLGRFKAGAEQRGMKVQVRVAETCPIVRLAPTWDEYLATLGKKDRHELRRKVRRAQEAGRQEILSLSDPREVEDAMDIFFRLHQASDPEKAAFLDRTTRAFFAGVASAFAKEGWVRLHLMKIDGVDVAASLSFNRDDRVLLYNSGLDPAYRAHSVGIALHSAEIQGAIADGRSWYDFLRGNESYKYGFGAEDHPVYSLTIRSSPKAGGGYRR